MGKVTDIIIQKLKEKEKPAEKNKSRKYRFILLVFIAATLMCAIPPILAVFVFKIPPLVILSGGEWITIMSMLGGFYFGANVIQKKLLKDEEISVNSDKIPANTKQNTQEQKPKQETQPEE